MKNSVIYNVQIADGRGSPLRRGGVAIIDGRLAPCPDAPQNGMKNVDGGNLVLAPGFIDAHGHSDISALAAPECVSKISQGITTEIAGNCGLSPFPLTARNREHLEKLYQQYNVKLNWNCYSSYAAELRRRAVRLKLVSLCGHNTLRGAVNGYGDTPLPPQGVENMAGLLAAELRSGAAGLSCGLLYNPGCFADRAELIGLLRCLAPDNAVFAAHLRSEGDKLTESIQECADAALQACCRNFQISHLKTAGAANWHKLPDVMRLIDEYGKKGLTVNFDRYPYIESMTQLSVVAPGHFASLDDETLSRTITEENFLPPLRAAGRDWRDVRLCSTACAEFAACAGQSIADIATRREIEPEQLVFRLLKQSASTTMAAFRGMSAENMSRIITDRRCFCGSDESARPEDFSLGASHPRNFGAMPEFLHILLDCGVALPQAIARLTGECARRFGLHDRGVIAPGMAADLVLFSPQEFAARSDFARPHRKCGGVAQVWIDGVEQLS